MTSNTNTASMRWSPRHFTTPHMLAAIAVLLIALLMAAPALAATPDPFATAVAKACAFQNGLKRLAGVVGMIGMTVCLMLGYFNKLNWRWVATCLGCCFALGTVPAWVMALAGGGC